MKLALLLIVSYIAVDICCSLLWPLPNSKRVQACYDSVRNENVDDFIGSQKVWHCQHLYKNMSVPSELTEEDNERKKYLDSLIEGMFGGIADTRRKRQINTTPCRRKELRMLSLEERSRLFAAMNNLKTDTSVRPNKYDAIALIHTGEMNLVAHNGAGFLGWHILFLLIFEAALRQVDRSVCLPYWDSTLDSMLPNPTLSELWSPEFMGTPRGAVVQGPFANWRLPRGESLSRDVDLDGELMTPTNVRNILSRSRYEENITSPTTSTRYDIEFIHGGPHVFVGGTMSSLDTAAFEPMFFFHHSYINYIYVRFRSRLRSLGRNPAVYPRILGADFRHAPNYPTGLGSYTQADGYADYFERLSVYEPVPTCSSISPSCGNRFLTCQNGLCLPRLTSGRSKRSISIPGLVDPIEVTNILSQGSTRSNTCDTPDAYITPYNDFCVDGACDTSLWAGVSYKIIAARRPNSPVFRNFPVIKGRVDVSRDIYEPSAYDETK
uniref:Tyrosinase copper-binding domain-containing protein n=1 Tax=Biomphalaria glabrata TaxID=6526 RepID=A0A2C9LHZ0_BIOGL